MVPRSPGRHGATVGKSHRDGGKADLAPARVRDGSPYPRDAEAGYVVYCALNETESIFY